VAGVASAVLASAGPYALLPFEDLARAAGAEATVSVAFVIDFGGSAPPVVGCVKVPDGTNGYQALAAFTTQEQEQAPTYNAAQLLCSINGDPSGGCGQAVGDGYIYWSYWHGSTGTCQYATTGAFGDVQAGDVEGWRFEDPGKANPSDPSPAASPDYSAICGPASTATSPTSAPGPPASTTSPVGASPSGGQPPSSSGPAPGGAGAPAAHPTTTTGVPPVTVPGSAAGSHAAPPSTAPRSGPHAQSLRVVNDSAGRAGGNGALPAAIGAGLVAVVAGLAFWRWRKRPRMP
jgi:hypothetical protein